jgi:serine/threonine protein kinase
VFAPSFASDVYALGACIWCILCGIHEPPIIAHTDVTDPKTGRARTFRFYDFMHRGVEPQPLPDIIGMLPMDLPARHEIAALLTRCLATDPAARPSASHCLHEIRMANNMA